ncbi:hypothetical protein DNTS_029023, partial [Danionella cerebrum]
SHHHHQKVLQDQDTEPIAFTRLTDYLTEVIKPAKMTTQTKTLIEGNARNWAYTTQWILRDHYAECIEREEECLADLMIEDWRSALEIATKWYQNKFKKKHLTQPIEEVKAILTSLADESRRDPPPGKTDALEIDEGVPHDSEPLPPRRSRHSPPSSTEVATIHRPEPPPSTPLPARTPGKPGRRSEPRTQNPTVVNTDDFPDMLNIGLCPTQRPEATPQVSIPRPYKNIHKDPPQMVIVHPEIQNPELVQETGQDTELIGTNDLSVDSLLCIAEQEMESEPLPMPQLTPIMTPDSSPRLFKVTRHLSVMKKMISWSFCARKKWCIVGDSNLSRIPPHNVKDLQVDSYPGATFRHAEAFISRATTHTEVEMIILAFGLNHRGQKQRDTAIKQLQRAVKAVKNRFPHATIWIPLINYSKNLKKEEKTVLTGMNAHITKNMPYLPLLPDREFQGSTVLNRRIKGNFESFMKGGELLHGYRVISAYKKNRNLKDILIKSKLGPV